jgi:hypothetical protein
VKDPDQQAFLEEFTQVLLEKRIDGLFGLCRYPGDDFKGRVEITQGRSNINLKFKDVCFSTRPRLVVGLHLTALI